MIFKQLFEEVSSTYTYILADKKNKEAIIIDSVLETVDRDLKQIEELGINLKWILETHVHADHVTGAYVLREKTGAKIGMNKSTAVACANHLFTDGEMITVGDLKIKVISTPGHTNGCTSYYLENKAVFTGDTLLIRGCGRTDFQEGSSELLFQSVREKLFKLPDSTFIYPAHDYKGLKHSSIGEEKQFNPRLKLANTKEQFVEIMKNLNLDQPKQIDRAVPANMNCGKIG